MYGKILTAGAVLALGMNVAHAAVTANYGAAPSSAGADIVGPFDTFDAAQGVALVAGGAALPTFGTILDVYYQAHLQGHQLGGLTLPNGGLNSTYEVTIVARFKEIVTGIIGTTLTTDVFPHVDNGAWIYVDTTPDYNYISDSGFVNGDLIATGAIMSGTGSVTNFGFGAVGFQALTNIAIVSQDVNVFNPDLLSANGIFTLSTFGTSTVGVSKVLGQVVNPGDLLIAADGNITVTAVPVPAAVWLLGSALAGFVTVRRRD